jgi:hypothetical protein
MRTLNPWTQVAGVVLGGMAARLLGAPVPVVVMTCGAFAAGLIVRHLRRKRQNAAQ